jgi:tRNA (guanine-N7-)-methyltransferase
VTELTTELTEAGPVDWPRAPASFVRRGGRMTSAQRRWLEQSGARYLLPVSNWPRSTVIAPQPPLDQTAVFGRQADLVVELGSGQGEALAQAAARHPEVNYLGFEVFAAALAMTVGRLAAAGADHVRLVAGDGLQGLRHLLGEASCQEIWVFFPDPWPKARQRKRRLVAPPLIDLAASRLRLGGVLRLATDWTDYAAAMTALLDCDQRFRRLDQGRFADRPTTKYEARGLRQGRLITDLTFVRHDPAD